MNPQTKKSAAKSLTNIDALTASVSTLRFLLDTVARSNRNEVDLNVTVTSGTATAAKISVTCKGDEARCEQIGINLANTGKWACQSLKGGGVKCTEV